MSKYINLIDYLDKPELIQHEDGTEVLELHHFPNNQPYARVLAVFPGGQSEFSDEEGVFPGDNSRSFILKPKPKCTVTGWRRGIIYPSGRFQTHPMFCPTKEDFKNYASNCKLFGPWESETIEIEED